MIILCLHNKWYSPRVLQTNKYFFNTFWSVLSSLLYHDWKRGIHAVFSYDGKILHLGTLSIWAIIIVIWESACSRKVFCPGVWRIGSVQKWRTWTEPNGSIFMRERGHCWLAIIILLCIELIFCNIIVVSCSNFLGKRATSATKPLCTISQCWFPTTQVIPRQVESLSHLDPPEATIE